MPNQKVLVAAIEHLLCDLAVARQNEAMIEAYLIQFLVKNFGFAHSANGEDANSKLLKSQVSVPGLNSKTRNGRKDVVLKLNKKEEIVVEIKVPDDFGQSSHRNDAIRQAVCYMLATKPRPRFGIVTDGKKWLFFELLPSLSLNSRTHHARRILAFDLARHKEFAALIFQRCYANTLGSFLKTFASAQNKIDSSTFDAIMNLDLNARIKHLLPDGANQKDMNVLRSFYSGGFQPVDLVEMLFDGSERKVKDPLLRITQKEIEEARAKAH